MITGNFAMNIAQAQLNPDTDSKLNDLFEVLDWLFTVVFAIELAFNAFGHWFWEFVRYSFPSRFRTGSLLLYWFGTCSLVLAWYLLSCCGCTGVVLTVSLRLYQLGTLRLAADVLAWY
eukprot:2359960-Rhodomonas_salina.1